jgi:hypothetical protein
MNYVNYVKLTETHRVKIVGWPLKDFTNPASVTALADMRTLRDAWQSGAACWVRLSASDLKKFLTEVEEPRNSGEIIGKKRKWRSDAGKPKPKCKAVVELDKDDGNMSGDDNEEGPTLTKKTRSRKLAQTSAGRTK